MNKTELKKIADALAKAEKTGKAIPQFSKDHKKMTVQDAYKIHLMNMEDRFRSGEHLVGMKIGLTSLAMQHMLGIDTPDYGHLTDKMLILEGTTCKVNELIAPKVEGELAFCLKKSLKGPAVTIADVYKATKYVVPAIEVVDSRVKDWKIGYFDTVADNGSSARFVVGSGMTPIEDVDMRLTGMNFEKNGDLIASGTTAEVLGNPAAAVAWLANSLYEFGIELKSGQIILSGALTAAVPAKSGDNFTVSFAGMGSVGLRFE